LMFVANFDLASLFFNRLS